MHGYLLVLAAAVLWGLIGLQSRFLLEAGISAVEIAFWRAAIAGAVFAAHAGLSGPVRLPRGRDLGAFAGFGLVGVAVFYSAYALAVETGGVSLASILLYTAPAFVAIAAHLLLGESLTRLKVGLVSLTLVGVILVASGGGTGITVSTTSVLWGLLAAVSYSSYYLVTKWALRRHTITTMYAVVLPIGALALLPFVDFAGKGTREWLLLVCLALVSTYAAYGLYAVGLRRVEASRAVVVATVEPVVAAAAGAVVFGERLGPLAVLGAGLIIAAAAGAGLSGRSRV